MQPGTEAKVQVHRCAGGTGGTSVTDTQMAQVHSKESANSPSN